jgi:phosphodiesterase/alkaline phosphatase D-like protein
MKKNLFRIMAACLVLTTAISVLTACGKKGDVSSTAATLWGTVNSSNDSTSIRFEYGLTTSYGSSKTAKESPLSLCFDCPVSCDLSGLSYNTTYHYRVVAENSKGPTNGADQTFTTSAVVPTVTTGSAVYTATDATLSGTVIANNASTTVTFEYGLDTNYGSTVTAAESPATGMGETTVSKEIKGLNPKTTYHFRVVGVNTEGTSRGSDATFTTEKAAPVASTNAASPIAPTGATLHGTVNAMNDSTTVTFQYGKTKPTVLIWRRLKARFRGLSVHPYPVP